MSFAVVEAHPNTALIKVYIPPFSQCSNDEFAFSLKVKYVKPGLYHFLYGCNHSDISYTIPIHLWPTASIGSFHATSASKSFPKGTIEVQLLMKSLITQSIISRFFRRQRKIEKELCEYSGAHEGGQGFHCIRCKTEIIGGSNLSEELLGVVELPSDEWVASCDSLACEECAPINITNATDPEELLNWLGLGDRILSVSRRVVNEKNVEIGRQGDPILCLSCGLQLGEVATNKVGDYGLLNIWKSQVSPVLVSSSDNEQRRFETIILSRSNKPTLTAVSLWSEVYPIDLAKFELAEYTAAAKGTAGNSKMNILESQWFAEGVDDVSGVYKELLNSLEVIPLPPSDAALGEMGVLIENAFVTCLAFAPLLPPPFLQADEARKWPASVEVHSMLCNPATSTNPSLKYEQEQEKRNMELKFAVLDGPEIWRTVLSVVCLKKKK